MVDNLEGSFAIAHNHRVYDQHDRSPAAIDFMPTHPHQFTGETFALRLAAFYAALFITLGVQLPLLPVWFAAKGLDPQTIGLVLAVPMMVRVFAIPAAARVADRRDALRAVIVITAGAAVVGFAALAMTEGLLAIIVVFALASAAYTPVMLLADAYALRGLMQRGRAYGPVRLWGSAAFIVASFGAGYLLDAMAPRHLIWPLVGALALTAVVAWLLAPLGPGGAAGHGPAPSAMRLLRDPGFLAVAGAAGLIQASHAVYYGFSTIDWQAAGFDGVAIGALWALGVVAEIALFAVSARLPPAITPTALLVIGAAGAVIRWTAMAFSPPAAVLPALQCLHALSFGATHLGTLGFVVRVAPAGLGATAQGYLAVVLGLTMAVAMGFSGFMYGRYGALAYAAMALAASAGGLLALAAHRIVRTSASR
jgi:PPP family 3-phenylpropionic acid transporter